MRKNNIKSVLLIGNYGFGNCGDEAMLSTNIRHLRKKFPNANLTVVSIDPRETAKFYQVRSCYMLSPKILFELINTDLVVFGSGSLFNSRFAGCTNGLSIYALFCAVIAKVFFFKKIELHAIGVEKGEINSLALAILLFIIRKSEEVTVRDKVSEVTLKGYGLNKVKLVHDPAIKLSPISSVEAQKLLAMESVDLNKPLVGLNARFLNYSSLDIHNMRTLAKFIDYVIKEYNTQFVFIPFAVNKFKKVENDIIYADTLFTQLNNESKVNFKILKARNYTPSEIKGIIKEMRVMIGTRLHSIVFSYSVRVPLISLNYSSKNTGFLKTIRQENNGIAPNKLTLHWLKETFSNLYLNRDNKNKS